MTEAILDRLAGTPTVDITTTGAKSGRRVRIEIWGWVIDDRYIITGTPGPRHWMANVLAEPAITIHLADRDIEGRAVVVDDPELRRRVFSDPRTSWYLTQTTLEDLVERAPMIEVLF